MSEYPNHPAADLFPMMGEPELQELADDIKANGLIERIILHDGMVLDGRNRYAACVLAGVVPLFQNPDPPIASPWVYVLSKNLHRRHLTVSQRAAIAAETLPHLMEEANLRSTSRLKNQQHTSLPSINGSDAGKHESTSAAIAAKAAQVGESIVERAWKLKKDDPEVFEKVKRGELTVNAARAGHKEPPKRGGQPKDITTGRGKQRAEAQKRRMIDALSTIGGVCHGLSGLDVPLLSAVCDSQEISTWAVKAETHARDLKRFAAKLKGINNGEFKSGQDGADAGGCTGDSPEGPTSYESALSQAAN